METNYHHARGGLIAAPHLGNNQSIHNYLSWRFLLIALILGGLIVMAIYHVMIFSLRTQNLATLYFSVVCLLLCIRTFQVEDSYVFLPMLKFNYTFSYKLEYLGFAGTITAYALFCRAMFGTIFNRHIVGFATSSGLLYCAIILFSSVNFFSSILIYYQIVGLTAIVLALGNLIYCVIKKSYGSRLFLSGMGVFFAASFIDIIGNMLDKDINMSVWGLYIFIYSQAFLIARKLNR